MNQIDKMFEYNLWANTQLIELCSTLVEDQLEMEVEGVFGRIQPTIVHLVRAEGGYIKHLTGSRPWADDLDWDNMSIPTLLQNAKISGARLAEIASQVNPATTHTVNFDGNTVNFYNWTVVLQTLYHGIEHRTQIKILLTQLGVEHPELAAWDYVESLQS